MGHIINPISWRLSHIKIWKNSFAAYELYTYSSLNTVTHNIVKVLEVLCRRRIARGNLFFFGGLKYLTSANKSLILFNFKSRFYYMFILSSNLFTLVKKKVWPSFSRNLQFTDKNFLNLIHLKKKVYFKSRLYYNSRRKVVWDYLRFYWPIRKYCKIKRPGFVYKNLFRFINYFKFVKSRRRFQQEFYIFFKSLNVAKNGGVELFDQEAYLINLYLYSLIKRKKKFKFKRNLNIKRLIPYFKKIKNYSAVYLIRRFFSYKFFRKAYDVKSFFMKNKLEMAINNLWPKFMLKYKLWRLFFELPIVTKFKLFLIKFLSRYFDLRSRFTLFFFLGRGVSYVDSSLMRDFLLIKIRQKFKVTQLYKASAGYLIKLLRLGIIRGFKIFLAGRFSRKDRATFSWHKLGRLPLNNAAAKVDYAAGAVAVRYSTCATKVWIYF